MSFFKKLFNFLNKERKTVEYYDDNAENWSETHHSHNFWEGEIELFNKYLPKGKIFEVGSGGGRDAHELSKKGYKYIGTDISEGLLKIAQKNNPDLKFKKQSVYDLDFKGDVFDGFWASAVLLHIPKNKIKKALKSIYKNLKKGAIGFISVKKGEGERMIPEENDYKRLFSFYSEEDMRKNLESTGFEIIKSYERSDSKKTTWLIFFVKKA